MLVDIPIVMASHGLEVVGPITPLQERPRRLVARVETRGGPLVIKAASDPDAFTTEAAAIARLAGHGLPVSGVVAVSPGPPSYLVLSWTEGEQLTSSSPLAAQREAGALLRRVHTIRPAWLGETRYAGEPTWDRWMAGWLNSALAWVSRHDPLDTDRVWAWFHALVPLLATRGHDLVLFDGRPDHWIVRGEAMAGLIDVSELRVGDAAMDLGVLAVSDPDLLTGVLDGYRPDPEERAVFDQLVPFYTFLRRISAAEYYQRFGTPDEVRQMLARIAATEVPACERSPPNSFASSDAQAT
jgi:aminoglycoside phosphotransferase (APT) family kinase protein